MLVGAEDFRGEVVRPAVLVYPHAPGVADFRGAPQEGACAVYAYGPSGQQPVPRVARYGDLEGAITYSVSQCSWATSGLPRLSKNEKGATTPTILHKAADQPEVQYHCITL